MEPKNKHKSNSLDKYLLYFKNALPGRERNSFEKAVMQDKFEQEAFEGLSGLNYEEIRADLQDIQNRISKKRKKSILLYPVFRYAASIVLLISIGGIIYLLTRTIEKTPQLAEQIKAKDSLPKSLPIPVSADTAKTIAQNIQTEATEKSRKEIFTSPVVPGEALLTVAEDHLEDSYVTEQIPADEEAAPVDMEEVVVTGYGVQKKSDITGAVSSVELEKDIPLEAEQSLQGKAAGISVTRGKPGSESKVLIRGLASIGANTETTTIQGMVTSASDGTPLPGVTVMLEGTAIGTITDINGNFSLEVPANEMSTLQFSMIGYSTEDYEVTGTNSVSVAMIQDLVALDEVVVIGYGAQKKSELTGAVSSVTMEEPASAAPLIIHAKPYGGMKDFREFINKNIQYDSLPGFDKTVIVKLSFVLTTRGEITNITIEKSAGGLFDAEAIRLLTSGPRWMTATENGVPFEEKVNLKIKFPPKETGSSEK